MANPKIIIGLLSCDKYESRAQICRSTWIPRATQLGIPVFFLRGGRDKPCAQLGDVLRFNVPENYDCLPQRTRAFCKWTLDNTDADVVFKADDDTFVVAERLAQFEHLDAHLFGNEPGGRYRGYCSGGAGYGLSRDAIKIIAEHMTAKIGAEDRHVKQTLASHGIKPFFANPRRFVAWGIDAPDRRPTKENNIITTHQIPVPLWMKIHEEIYG
jgi:hypothetical protein